MIDLGAMRAVAVDPDRRVAEVGPGATWHDVDQACAVHGLATTGGLISTTGVAGLILGGGIGWLQRRFGLACDNLRAAQVVTAEAEVLDADVDLLWGLRGGGNFGIVTRFTFDLHPVSIVLGGLLAFPLDRGAEVLRAFREWAVEAPDDATLLASIMTAPLSRSCAPSSSGRRSWCCSGAGAGTSTRARPRSPRCALGPAVDHFGPMPYPILQSMLDGAAPAGLRNYYRGGYLAELTDDVIDLALRPGARLPSPMSQIHFHQMGGAVGRVSTASSAFSGRDACYTYNLVSSWPDAADDTLHITASRAVAAELAPHATGRTYVNFEGEPGSAHAAYGDVIYDRLARLKRQYDPANVFCRNQNVRPAP